MGAYEPSAHGARPSASTARRAPSRTASVIDLMQVPSPGELEHADHEQ